MVPIIHLLRRSRKKQTKIKPEDEFLELIHDNYDPFPSESKNPKKDENTQVSQFPIDSEEITDYTDTLTTWVRQTFILILEFFIYFYQNLIFK